MKPWRSEKFKKGAIISIFFNRLFIRINFIEADLATRKVLGGSGGMLLRKIFENLHVVMTISVLFEKILRKFYIFLS